MKLRLVRRLLQIRSSELVRLSFPVVATEWLQDVGLWQEPALFTAVRATLSSFDEFIEVKVNLFVEFFITKKSLPLDPGLEAFRVQ